MHWSTELQPVYLLNNCCFRSNHVEDEKSEYRSVLSVSLLVGNRIDINTWNFYHPDSCSHSYVFFCLSSLEDLHIIQSWYRGNRMNPSSCDCLCKLSDTGLQLYFTNIHLQLIGCEKEKWRPAMWALHFSIMDYIFKVSIGCYMY